MATIELYRTGKRTNSTLRPKFVAGDSYESNTCEFFEPLDILNPTIILREEALPNLPHDLCNYNYVYIQNPLDRYYWITKWTRQDGLWYADCTVDYLGSWRNTILESEQYITRSSIAYNNSIPDDFYGYKLENYTRTKSDFVSPAGWQGFIDSENTMPTGYRYIIGVNCAHYTYTRYGSTNVEGYTDSLQESTNYFVVSRNDLFSNIIPSIKNGGANSDSSNLQAIDYITTIFALPTTIYADEIFTPKVTKKTGEEINLQTNYSINRIYFGNMREGNAKEWTIGGPDRGKYYWWLSTPDGCHMIDPFKVITRVFNAIPIQQPSLQYLKSAAYRKMYIQFNPFGLISIPTENFADSNYIGLILRIQPCTGDAVLTYNAAGVETVAATANLAIPIKVGATSTELERYRRQTIQNGINIAQAAINNLTAPLYVNGQSPAAVAASAIAQGLRTLPPVIESIWKATDRPPANTSTSVGGATGSVLIDNTAKLIVEQYDTVGRFDERFGRPLCEKRILGSQLTGATSANNYKISNPGLVVCQGAQIKSGTGVEIGTTMLSTEREAIETAMNGGIYLE